MKLFLNDKFILFLIVLNSLAIFVGEFDLEPPMDSLIKILDNSVTVLFLFEVLIKIRTYGRKEYFASGWNIFDFVLVLVSIPSLLALNTGFLLTFRVLRLFKSFRFFKFIPNVDQLISGVQRALKASVFILVGFIIYIFVVGVFSTILFGNVSPDFVDPFHSLYTIFQIFTGEGWNVIANGVASNYTGLQHGLVITYFVFIFLTGGILGLSLINSIFVDAMVRDNNDELENKVDVLTEKINQLIEKV